MKATYWNHNGLYQDRIDALQALIPVEGSVPKAYKNKALERFRKAVNCYYDLYNNGLCNRRASFAKLFGFTIPSWVFDGRCGNSVLQRYYDQVEEKMNEFVLAALQEQGL